MKRLVIASACVGLLSVHAPVSAQCTAYVDASVGASGAGTSWANAYQHLQEALGANPDCDEIWVADGAYMPDGGRTPVGEAHVNGSDPDGRLATFQLLDGVAIYGGFDGTEATLAERDVTCNETILSGDLLGDDEPEFTFNNDNSYHVVTGSGTVLGTAVIDGFSITGANANAISGGCDTSNHHSTGGGVIVYGFDDDCVDGQPGGNPIIQNCTIRDNSARWAGGMLVYRSNATLLDCVFENNRATEQWGGALEISGGCVPASFGAVRIERCSFINNRSKWQGGAVTAAKAQNVVIANSVFVGNTVETTSCPPSIPDCRVGGGVYFQYANYACTQATAPKLVNCTFVDNVATPAVSPGELPAEGGGVYTDIDFPEIENCVFWGNLDSNSPSETSQIHPRTTVPLVRYSAIEDLVPNGQFDIGANEHNIPDEPAFRDRLNGDVHLNLGSAGNDAGDNLAADALGLAVDRDGQPRPWNDPIAPDDGGGDFPFVDMGAYEFVMCANGDDCGDTDSDGVTDDACKWFNCGFELAGVCYSVDRTFADAGGQFGACPTDGFCNVHDKNHVLACFAGTNPCDGINMDLGGSFGACPPDGWCNIHDWYHANNCFKGTSPCSCPSCGSGWSAMMGPGSGGATGLAAVPVPVSLSPNVRRVRIFTTGALADIQGYQLDPILSGGTSGQLELLDITIESRADFVFAGRTDTYEAFNLTNGQMLCGVDGAGVATTGRAYLATYTYRVPLTAAGDFVLDIRRDEAAGDQTFLIASGNARIEVSATTPGIIAATPAAIP